MRSPTLSTSNLRINVGAVYQIAHDVWIAVAYHTPPEFSVQTELSGHASVTRAPRDGGAQLRYPSVVEVQYPASVDAELRARLPHQLDLHVGGRWEDLSRLDAYDVRIYGSTSVFNGIPEWTERPIGMHDAFAGWIGVEQVDTGGEPHLLYGARVGFESFVGIGEPDLAADRRTGVASRFDLGAQRRISRNAVLQVSYGLQYFPTVNARNTAYNPTDRLTCIASGFDYATDACKAVRDGYAIPTAAGDYERIEHAVRIGLRFEIP